MVKSEASQVAAPNNASALPISVVAIAMLKTCSTDPTAVIVSQKAIPWRQGKKLDPCETALSRAVADEHVARWRPPSDFRTTAVEPASAALA